MSEDKVPPAPPRIASVAAVAPFVLRVCWKNGQVDEIDVEGLISTYRVFKPLRQDPGLFSAVRAGEYDSDVIWTDQIDMSSSTLWRLANEQRSGDVEKKQAIVAEISDVVSANLETLATDPRATDGARRRA